MSHQNDGIISEVPAQPDASDTDKACPPKQMTVSRAVSSLLLMFALPVLDGWSFGSARHPARADSNPDRLGPGLATASRGDLPGLSRSRVAQARRAGPGLVCEWTGPQSGRAARGGHDVRRRRTRGAAARALGSLRASPQTVFILPLHHQCGVTNRGRSAATALSVV
jgi:hypothetical protein